MMEIDKAEADKDKVKKEGKVKGLLKGEPCDPLLLFPKEVWNIIFGNLEEPQDLLNCMRGCRAFENILKPRECTWLFKAVFPSVFKHLDKSDILACRKQGKDWMGAVDGYLQNHSHYRPFDETTKDYQYTTLHLPLTDKGLTWTEFRNLEQLEEFMKLMSAKKNPFVSRSIWIQFQEDAEVAPEDEAGRPRQFWPTVFEFLSLYGEHVWYFSMGTFGSMNSVSRFLYLLRGCLARLPNLKSLHLFGWLIDDFDLEDGNEVDGRMEEVVGNGNVEDEDGNLNEDNLPGYLERKPLPTMPFLETIEVEYMEDLPDEVYEHFIGLHGEQLKCLRLTKWSFLTLNSSFPCLKELHLKLDGLDALDKFFMRLNSPVAKLNLDFSCVEASLDMQRLFRLISDNFEDTLRVLQITVMPYIFEFPPTNEEPIKKPDPRLRTPFLQTLQIENFKKLPFNFLLDVAPSLQYLHIRHLSSDMRCESHPGEIIDVFDFLHCHRVYESNVWSHLPKLKLVSSEFYDKVENGYARRFYGREMREYLVRNNKLNARE